MPSCYYCGYEFDESDTHHIVGRFTCPSCGASNPMNAHDTGR